MQGLVELVSKINVYERSRGRALVNIGITEAAAKYITDMLWMLGLGEGALDIAVCEGVDFLEKTLELSSI